jgi:hypothetical protein
MPRENDHTCVKESRPLNQAGCFAAISKLLKSCCELVPLAGLEPARCCHQQILSLPRLPIPPQGLCGRDNSHDLRSVNPRAWSQAPIRSK